MEDRKAIAAPVGAVVLVLAAVGYTVATSPVSIRDEDRFLVDAYNGFGIDLFQRTASDGGNVFISPISIALALSMTLNGADGETREAIAGTLGLSGIPLEDVNQAADHILAFLDRPDRDVKLLLTNSIWAREGVNLSQEFLETCGGCYDAEARSLNFSSPEAVGAINHWISKETKGRIPEMLEQIDPSNVMFLANAIYFQGTWTKQFSRKLTRDEEFFLPDGTTKMHPMMRTRNNEELSYLDEDSFKAVELTYGEREKLSMYVFLPEEMDAFFRDLNLENWDAWMGRFQEGEGMVIMPKFKVEYGRRLNEILGDLGMEIAFGPEANFSRMVNDDWLLGMLYLAYVNHRAIVEVDERGTEAAGVSLVAAKWLGGAFHMKVAGPFFFVIRDNPSGAILFMGLVEDPSLG